MNKRSVGLKWENTASDFLKAKGFKIIYRNFRCRQGEIDIIGYDGDILSFIEVKYRSSGNMGDAASAVNILKQRKISRVSDYFRACQQIPYNTQIRYDVVAIDNNEIKWLKNAFCYIG